ncbi:hypothetical protein [Actinomadura harenae]|uniref:Uncharacterized protein n=1 Tax=Actinomadura harenae TaxID=2483351 RepID=A0A3M2MH26_9ACTN|nr:hypothetical protein [Actinomadura harenae]RMI46548.1 hypothetical protein EBO15_06320 [Actinomadura harenae]
MDPITIAVLTAATGKAVEMAGDPVRNGTRQLYALIRGRFKDDEELAKAEEAPEGPEKARALSGVIRRAAEADPEVRREAEALEALIRQAAEANQELWRELETLRAAVQAQPRASYSNNFYGSAQKVVQINNNSGSLDL